MARAKGFQGIIGLRKGSTWGTAVVPGTLHGIYVDALTPGSGRGIIRDSRIRGSGQRLAPDMGVHADEVTITMPLPYEGAQTLIALLMGTAGVPATVDTSARLHLLKPATNNDGIFGTIAYEYLKDALVGEFSSVKIDRITLRWQVGNSYVMLEAHGIADQWLNDSGSNTTTTIDSITFPSIEYRAIPAEVAVEMNGQSAGALGSAPLYVTSGELTIARPLERRYSTRLSYRTDEPVESQDGMMTISGSFTLPAIDSASGGGSGLHNDQVDGTRKKATITITSTVLAGAATQYFQHKLWLPHMTLLEARPGIPFAGAPTQVVPFECSRVLTVPTGFTSGYLDAVTWENYNTATADALA